MTNAKFLKWMRENGACEAACDWVRKSGYSRREVWDRCNRGDWLLWWAARDGVSQAQIVRAACACARTALRYVQVGDDRPRLAIEAAERWCDDPCDAADAARAADAASAAYADAAAAYVDAADAARAAAAYAAAAAAADAARAAAAYAAADAASDAARADAARAAAAYAASAAASAAAYAAAYVDAADAARAADIVRGIIKYDELKG